jgi:glucose/arabinose dehydrogenase
LFIVEQWTAQIRIKNLTTNTMNALPFIDLNSVTIGSGNERGLLGMAWDPAWPDSQYFYVHYNNNAGNSVIARYRVSSGNPDRADSTSGVTILTVIQPPGGSFTNHKSGMIAFGPNDSLLYVSFGDGGSGNDPDNRAQSDTTRLGKMLRLDARNLPYTIPPSNPWAADTNLVRREFWAKGLRNPWRWSFDPLNGDLLIGDVGQGAWEEIDYQPYTSTGGVNYGWRCMEGNNHCTGLSGCTCPDVGGLLTEPVHEYSHGSGRCSVTGGYVYRGCKIPELYGRYFFAEYCTDQIWSVLMVGGVATELTERTADLVPDSTRTITGVSSFGVDGAGELYICDHDGGEIFKIVPDTLFDCNGNGCADVLDILWGVSSDSNGTQIPDECECFAQVVSELSSSADSMGTLTLIWTAYPATHETYRAYRAQSPDALFPSEWTIIADNLPVVAGPSAMTLTDSTAGLADRAFYVVTSLCP